MNQATLPANDGNALPIAWEKLPWEIVPVQGTTDRGRVIPLFTLRATADQFAHLLAKAKQQDVEIRQVVAPTDGMIRTAPPDLLYDCHGWVFTGGRYFIAGRDIEWILLDNDYQLVLEPEPGDLAIYRDSTGTIRHSGIVVAITNNNMPLVESKWGYIGRYISPAYTRTYRLSCTFYHSSRNGHCLRGAATA
jgi:hypothetical protein